MTARKIVVGALSVLVAAFGLVVLVPLAAGHPSFMPAPLYAIAARWSKSYDQYHGTIPAEIVGIASIAIAIALYLRYAEPDVITLQYRPPKRK